MFFTTVLPIYVLSNHAVASRKVTQDPGVVRLHVNTSYFSAPPTRVNQPPCQQGLIAWTLFFVAGEKAWSLSITVVVVISIDWSLSLHQALWFLLLRHLFTPSLENYCYLNNWWVELPFHQPSVNRVKELARLVIFPERQAHTEKKLIPFTRLTLACEQALRLSLSLYAVGDPARRLGFSFEAGGRTFRPVVYHFTSGTLTL